MEKNSLEELEKLRTDYEKKEERNIYAVFDDKQ